MAAMTVGRPFRGFLRELTFLTAWVVAAGAMVVFPTGRAEAAAASSINIIAAHSGKCVAVDGSSQLPGAPLIQAECAGQAGAVWTLRPSASGRDTVNIINVHSNQCLEIAGHSGTPRARQAECNGQKEADFLFTDRETFAWIESSATTPSQCLQVVDGSHTHGAPIGLTDCHGQTGTAFRQRAPKTGNDPAAPPEMPMVTAADLENDGKADLAVLRAEGVITGHRNVDGRFDGGTVWSKGWANFLGMPGQGRLYFADVSGDGRADLVVHGTDGEVSVRTNKGTYFDGGTVWSEGWANHLAMPGQGSISFADVSGDGRADLVVHGSDGQIGGCVNLGDRFDAAVPMGRI
ncbi:RICIN domain-containing protein [Streptomyces sp. NPDC015345]|uniref:RICIN domain-containing protein n=1 Tax=Streptomyces sp. NPDC015345 TaxID=3364953 RepID=UPI0036FC473F